MVDNNNNIGASGAANHDEDGAMMKEQDQLLPIANVGRIMKQILPPNAKISKEAKETMQECVSEFISFVTSEASEKCRKERRKTVNGDDVSWALGALGFDDYTAPLRRFLHRYREKEGERISSSANNNNENNQDKANNNTEDQQQRILLNHPHIQRPNFNKGSSTTGL
ncbi:PREDICTED: nuclear transcription factor Y subunit B-5-like [Prunus mume]|uniref:Nuclear transcription factor Y subunit B-5-like n=1 Tax=Prunus mume TaxID=102107 RepID=A0ABM0NDG2_PRUMU|nr:PREDICTED: nuclear transcription factor Y subunit B-5-like [Prunus mume]